MVLAILLALSMAVSGLTGVVKDTSGGAVPGASVTVQSSSGAEQQTVTSGPDGRFSFATVPADAVLIVRAGGFAEQRQTVGTQTDVEVTLQPPSILETVVVTPGRTEQRLGDTPASVNVVTAEQIESSPAIAVDDVLRSVPSFSLFRRANSVVAQPTTQGVSLRGIGPSGQSRTLVLLDGVPFNDPFGGWVYWTRVPMVSVDRIEVTEDTASGLYGNYAMGGVINIVTSRPTARTLELKPQFGTFSGANGGSDKGNTPKFDMFASHVYKKVGFAVEGSALNTDGFKTVTTEAGPVDNNARVDYRNVTGKVEYLPSDRITVSGRVGYFNENRDNGKIGELNDTRWTSMSGGVRMKLRDQSDLQARVYGDIQKAHYNFLAVSNAATTRNLVRLATDQRVPVNGVGGMLQWQKAIGTRQALTAGADWRSVDGDSREDAYSAIAGAGPGADGVTLPALLTVQRISGGTQRSTGAFVQDVITPVEKLVITLNARVDHWRNYDGHNLETTVATGLPTANNKPSIPDRTDTVVSPRVASLYHVTDRVTVWGAINSGFRAPTLTELYRQFSVGAITTRPNAQLGPERLLGGELGLNVAPMRNLTARLTWFDNRVKDPVSNVTMTPSQPDYASVCVGLALGNCVQKQNLGRTKIAGVQTDVEYLIGRDWRVSGGYIFNNAKVTDGGSVNAGLVGKYLAQVPKNRGSLQVAYTNARIANVALAFQFAGLQYNDDQNVQFIPAATLAAAGYDTSITAGLPGYTTVDLMASRDLGSRFQVFVGAQNLTNKVFFVQTNPSTVGAPRMVNVGLRVRFASR
ncbi:MAG: TonB-dependent receptor [Acidobacteria bacterium]|nr:TonB-dependent receptor [Acidobacteriota bacterium]